MAEDSDKERKYSGSGNAPSSNTAGKRNLRQPIVPPGEEKIPPFKRTSVHTPGEALLPAHDWLTGEDKTSREREEGKTTSQPRPAVETWLEPANKNSFNDEDFFDDNEAFFADDYYKNANHAEQELRRCKRLQWLLLSALLIATVANVLLLML
jgi:hypothetical protein